MVDKDSWVDGYRTAIATVLPPAPPRKVVEGYFDSYFTQAPKVSRPLFQVGESVCYFNNNETGYPRYGTVILKELADDDGSRRELAWPVIRFEGDGFDTIKRIDPKYLKRGYLKREWVNKE
jgi:hypothetical protein